MRTPLQIDELKQKKADACACCGVCVCNKELEFECLSQAPIYSTDKMLYALLPKNTMFQGHT